MSLCPCIDRSGAYCFTDVHLSVRLSAENLTCELNIFHTIQVTMLIFGMPVAFDNSQRVRVNFCFQVSVKNQGYISQKLAISGALVFHKHILFITFLSATIPHIDLKLGMVLQVGVLQGSLGCLQSSSSHLLLVS